MLKFTKGLVVWTLVSPVSPLLMLALGLVLIAVGVTLPESDFLNGAILAILANAAVLTPIWALLSVPFCLRYWRWGLWLVAASIPLWLAALALVGGTML